MYEFRFVSRCSFHGFQGILCRNRYDHEVYGFGEFIEGMIYPYSINLVILGIYRIEPPGVSGPGYHLVVGKAAPPL